MIYGVSRTILAADEPLCTVLGLESPLDARNLAAPMNRLGRLGFVDLGGFDLGETGAESQDRLWNRGGFPRPFLAADDSASFDWRQSFVRTLLKRDISQLGISVPAETLRRFWTVIAHYHGQVWHQGMANAPGRPAGAWTGQRRGRTSACV